MVLHPLILGLGLLAASLPVIVHLLLRRRRQNLDWGAMRLVIQAYRSTRRRRLERWLLLAARVALLLAAGVLLARPIVGRQDVRGPTGDRTLWIVLDDSLTSAASGPEGLTDLARSIARVDEQLAKLGPTDRAGVILASSPPRALISPPSGDAAAVRAAIAQLKPTDARADWAGALALITPETRQGAANPAGPTPSTQLLLASAWRAGSLAGPLPRAWTAGEALLIDTAVKVPGTDPGTSLGVPASASSTQGARGTLELSATAPAPRTGRESNTAIASARALRPLMLTGEREAGQALSVDVVRSGELTGGEITGVVITDPSDAQRGRGEVLWSRGQSSASLTIPLEGVTQPQPSGTASARAAPAVARVPAGTGTSLLRVAIESADAAGTSVTRGTSPGAPPTASIAADDKLTLAVLQREALRVGLVDSAAQAESVQRLRPSQWVRLALRPSEASPIEAIDVPPSSIERPVLAGLDALWVLSPQSITDEAWARLARFVDEGGVLIFSPPAGVASHLWATSATRALGLPWRFSPSSREALGQNPARVITSLSPRAQGSAGATSASTSALPDVLSTLRGELEELASPVAITQWLSPDLSTPLDSVGPPTTSGPAPTDPAPALTSTAIIDQPQTEARVLLSLSANESGGETEPLLIAARAATARAQASSAARTSSGPGGGGPSGRGLVVYLAVAPDLAWTDLPAKPLFVAMVQEIVRQGVGGARTSVSLTAGQHAPLADIDQLRAVGSGAILRVGGDGGVGVGVGVAAQAGGASTPSSAGIDWPRNAGVYVATDAAGASRGDVVVNPDALASDVTPTSRPRVQQLLTGSNASDTAASITWLEGPAGPAAGSTGSGPQTSNTGTSAAGSSASGGAAPSRPSGSPIGAGPALLVIVLGLALVELALAWLTSRPQGPNAVAGMGPQASLSKAGQGGRA